ncbi:MAG: leucyl aminopeptidase, partial [Pseudomonadota bacterium]|nr:leucyl aminopeptidase [Pseudomonadota bacterium]
MKISFAKPGSPSTGIVVVSVSAGRKLSPSADKLNKKYNNVVSRAIKASRFKGEKGQTLNIISPEGSRLDRIMLVGLGKTNDISEIEMQNLGGRIFTGTQRAVKGIVAVLVDPIEGSKMTVSKMAAHMAYGVRLRSYRFDKYKTKQKPSNKPSIRALTLHCARFSSARSEYRSLDKIAEGIFFTRDLVSEPANIIYPESLAKEAKSLEKIGVTVELFNETQMKKLGMGALLGVGQGSIRDSKMVVMHWNGLKTRPGKLRASDTPIAFVGKGVTFDTGGISIKPSAGMEDMKWDMGGSGVVIGLMKALAGRKAKVNAVGVVGLVENMPGGNAQRPGDIVTSMSGQTIEVLNTDAEGRLVLADALWYTKERFKPKFMVNLATLTGAIIVSLGSQHAGLFSNNEILSKRLLQAGQDVDELLWRLPLSAKYDKLIDSDAADMK